jgi:RHS repeat-associated protein
MLKLNTMKRKHLIVILLLLISKTLLSQTAIYYDYDALGSVTQLTNKSGNVVEKYAYDIYGAPLIKSNNSDTLANSAVGNRLMFTGREYIQEIALYDYRNRMYSSTIGRFLQMDPIGFYAGDVNLYRYVENNSINIPDPFGLHDPEKTIGDEALEANHHRETVAKAMGLGKYVEKLNEGDLPGAMKELGPTPQLPIDLLKDEMKEEMEKGEKKNNEIPGVSTNCPLKQLKQDPDNPPETKGTGADEISYSIFIFFVLVWIGFQIYSAKKS